MGTPFVCVWGGGDECNYLRHSQCTTTFGRLSSFSILLEFVSLLRLNPNRDHEIGTREAIKRIAEKMEQEVNHKVEQDR
jgi:hypothetical protein